ncbi:hypothetical protein EVAR_102386_1 [Eumeta japonica]|uniref:Uncharacterized protein n=1 Tax=Eumeta variegata TaxID=151549 RepID=A0A4C1YNC6_EUMVA|nr:hypothetical protein EVAR_102386_1 [Eumeta japonica]
MAVQTKWTAASYKEERFLQNNAKWLTGTIKLSAWVKQRLVVRPSKSLGLSDRSKRRKTKELRAQRYDDDVSAPRGAGAGLKLDTTPTLSRPRRPTQCERGLLTIASPSGRLLTCSMRHAASGLEYSLRSRAPPHASNTDVVPLLDRCRGARAASQLLMYSNILSVLSMELMKNVNFLVTSVRSAKLVDANVMVKNEILDIVDTTSFLGLTLDTKLRWNSNITRLTQRLSSVAYAVKRIRHSGGDDFNFPSSGAILRNKIELKWRRRGIVNVVKFPLTSPQRPPSPLAPTRKLGLRHQRPALRTYMICAPKPAHIVMRRSLAAGAAGAMCTRSKSAPGASVRALMTPDARP